MSVLTVSGDVPATCARVWLAERTTPCARLDALYASWRAVGGEFPHGAREFLTWLARRGAPVTGLCGDPPETGNTAGFENFLDEDFIHTVFAIGGAFHVAVSWTGNVRDPAFFELTCDDPVEIYDWDHGWLACAGATRHVHTTEDTIRWRPVDPRTGEPLGDATRLRETREGAGLECPTCGALMTTGEAGY